MLCCGKLPKYYDLFQIPFGPIVTWNEITNFYPNICSEMDGSSPDSYLLFFYEMSPIDGVYKFQDEDTENDFAEILGVNFSVISEGETKEDLQSRKKDEEMERKKELEEKERLKSLLLFTEEYDRLMNPDSISSLSTIEDDDSNKRKKSSKQEKKERRRKLIDSRI